MQSANFYHPNCMLTENFADWVNQDPASLFCSLELAIYQQDIPFENLIYSIRPINIRS